VPTWEYRVVTSGTLPAEIANACDIEGADGWNLVSVIVVEAAIVLPDDPPDEMKTRLIFKRKVGRKN
jgi:hypothetical protein